ncbi:hypothetical protein BDV96DRAFT_591707 [Lophiotrema nucula]|uniref:Peptidase M20 domain-containing protein 2 n=1 Tax=Lophiotrema nucula TaxID=690887 RepID=A0A6A5YFE6_9PLEO|nr:hypothetical protein BDV96DRAFT_591707 [Lophiotrema nucula]
MEEDGFIIIPKIDQLAPCQTACQEDVQGHLSDIGTVIDNLSEHLWPLNKFIHDNPELAFKEYKAHAALVKFMLSQKGWNVTPSAYGMETAWKAEYDSGRKGPVVSFNVEMDALPDIGHACGHNLIAIASLAAGLATAILIQRYNLAGKVLIFGTPGEEGTGGGKIRLLKAGAYKDVHITLISHPGIPNNSAMVRTTAFIHLDVEYFGKAAHAANSPWLGVNALDALVIAYNAVSVLRQQTMSGDVVGMRITNGGAAANVIHAYAAGSFVLRATTSHRLKELQEKVRACLRAGAEATGARLKVTTVEGYADHVPNCVLAERYTRHWNSMPNVPDPPTPPLSELTYVKASTDQGNLSYTMPSVNVSFAIPPGPHGGRNHTPDFEIASGTKEAFQRALRVAKALSGAAVDVLETPGLNEKIMEQWSRDMAAIKEGSRIG